MRQMKPSESLHTRRTHVVKFFRIGLTSFVLITSCLLVAACGKLPVKVDAPSNVDGSTYSQTYPDISTDPSSGYKVPE